MEDEKKISDIVRTYLEREGFGVKSARSGREALRLVPQGFDLVILDLMLPDMDGESVCRAIRESSDTPIIMLTAKSAEDDRVRGLSIGADDYVVKPFSPRELVARVKAHLRRTGKSERRVLSFDRGTLMVDVSAMEVRKRGELVPLTPTEFKIMLTFAERPQTVLSRMQLVTMVQGYDFEGYDRVIDAHIKNIRQKIEDDPRAPQVIKTIYGAGYKFTATADK
ncbi:MAG: response regulator transcription factor [Chloroflexota bacterium]